MIQRILSWPLSNDDTQHSEISRFKPVFALSPDLLPCACAARTVPQAALAHALLLFLAAIAPLVKGQPCSGLLDVFQLAMQGAS